MNKYDPKECAFALMTFDDVEFAEFFVYADKMNKKGINGDGTYEYPDDLTITSDDVKKFIDKFMYGTSFMDELKEWAREIIADEDVVSYAWWKEGLA